MIGTRTPNLSQVSTILGTAAAACSVLTVTRTNSEPARANAIAWLTVDGESAVSVLVIDCTTMGWSPPTLTPPTSTTTALRRGFTAIRFLQWKPLFYYCAGGRRLAPPAPRRLRLAEALHGLT